MDGSPIMNLGNLQDSTPADVAERRVPGVATTHYHLHINCFTPSVPPAIVSLVADKALKVTSFTFKGEAGDEPLWIATTKFPTASAADDGFKRMAEALSADGVMRGYMETEVVRTDNIARFQERPYRADVDFPLSLWDARRAPRGADIHVFRSAASPRDELDARLASVGFYEVVNTDERIWTLLTGSRGDAEQAFAALKSYFATAGGVSKLELEYVRELTPFPSNFEVAPVYFAA